MPKMRVETVLPAQKQNVAVLRLEGSLDATSIEEVEKALSGLPKERLILLVNCRKLQFISSAGLGLFLETHGKLEGQGGRVVFAEVSQPEVHDAMNLLGFFDVFGVAESESQFLN